MSEVTKPRRPKRKADQVSATPEARAVRRAVKMIGGTHAVGRLVGLTQQAVQKWTEDPRRMAPMMARQLSKAGGYQVSVTDMRPDIFGDLTVQELGYLPGAYAEREA